MNLFILLFPLLAAALPATEPKDGLERLHDAANILMRISDADGPNAKLCQIKPAEARSLILPLHALLDKRMESFIRVRRGKNNLFEDKVAETCARACHCGLYSSVFERKGYANLSRADQVVSKKVTELAMNQTPADLVKCTDRISWFCGSDLLKYLKKEAE